MTGLLEALAALTGTGQTALSQAFLVFLRVGAMLALLPAFGEQIVPVRVRLAVALAFTAVVLPPVADRLPQVVSGPAFVTEIAAGLILGAGLRLLVLALQVAGTIAAQSASLSQLFGGMGAEPQPAMANLLVMAGLALAVIAGLHVRAAELLILSYQMMPAGRPILSGHAAQWGLDRIARAFGLGVSLAAPFVIAAFLYNLALGVINRAMPQMMVAMVGAPALSLGGLAILALSVPVMMPVWMAALSAQIEQPFAIMP